MEEFEIINNKYYFDCKRCGNCCTGDQKVFLNLNDVYKLACYHKFDNTKKLFDCGIVILVQDQNGAFLPRLRFKLKPYQFCPFLIHEETNGNIFRTRCSLHPDFKPLICSLAPVGRMIDLDRKTDEYIFVKPAPDCPGVNSKEENSLSDIKHSHKKELDYQYFFFRLLQKARHKNFTRREYLEKIYSLPTSHTFSEMLDSLKII